METYYETLYKAREILKNYSLCKLVDLNNDKYVFNLESEDELRTEKLVFVSNITSFDDDGFISKGQCCRFKYVSVLTL